MLAMFMDIGGTIGTMYGGNNAGGTTTTTNVQLGYCTITSAVFGGGNQANTTTSNVIGNSTAAIVPSIYGGGNAADVTTTNVTMQAANATNVYGGSNTSGTVTDSNVTTTAGTITNLYGGNNAGGTTTTSHVIINDGTLEYVFGGNNQAGETTTSNVTINGGTTTSVFGGNNQGGTTITSNVTTTGGTTTNVYGGNNAGGTTTTSNVTINGGTIADVYGGGDQAITNETNAQINGSITDCVYGGGNQAGVNTNTHVNLSGATIGNNIYGGGNEGTVTGDTNVHIYNSTISGSVYAGGNGTTAVVSGNTNLIMDGTTNTVTHNVFGGGNQAATGIEANNNSTSNVEIVNGAINGNVYGGANTSVVYGVTNVKIGYDAVNDTNLTIGNVQIKGTVFGGGEANASGSEVYDFSFISVTNGINMNINGNGHTSFYIKGSIFGSGNASSTSGSSYIYLKNYGSFSSPQTNTSIQRATQVVLENSAIAISGATDRTNEYSSVSFTISRVDEIKLKNNSTLYLNCGANLLKKFSSVAEENGQEVKAAVTVNADTGETTRNVNNRVYMAEGKNLNIATNEQVTAYGEVYGMTFFGLFTNTMNPSTSTGLYNTSYNNGDNITNAGTFSSNSYVIGQHKENHDTTVDGFYSNYDQDGVIRTKYIETTPADDVYYIWLVGIDLDVTTFNVSLTASKYATLGTYELGLTGFSTPNLKFILNGFSAGLIEGASLVDPSQIESIASSADVANNTYGLKMETGNNGWQTDSTTTFLTARPEEVIQEAVSTIVITRHILQR